VNKEMLCIKLVSGK